MNKKEFNLIKEKCKGLNILYVENEETVRVQTSKVFSLFFDNIHLASNGKEGLYKFKNNQIDMVFTDINMPIMDGLDMIKNIRICNEFVPIVVLSAYENTDYFLKTIEYGIDGYILKPFTLKQIQEVIQKIINKIQSSIQFEHTVHLIDNYEWHIETATLNKESKEISLTKNEKKLFKLLSTAKYAVFSSEEIEIELFDDNYCDNKRIRGLISRVNKKIGSHLIKSIYSEGYELNLEKTC